MGRESVQASEATVESVLRRAEISRLTRNLKSRLALATFKAKRGLQNYGLDSLEPQFTVTDKTLSLPHATGPAKSSDPAAFGGQLVPPREMAAAKSPFFKNPTSPKRLFAAYAENSRPDTGRGTLLDSATLGFTAVAARKRSRTIDTATPQTPLRRLPQSASVPGKMHASAGARDAFRAEPREASVPGGQNPSGPSGASGGSNGRAIEDPRNDAELRTPPPREVPSVSLDAPRTPGGKPSSDRDGANLLLYLATSPGPGRTPRTPRTPDFNFNEYLNIFTPSPGVSRPPHPVTPSSIARSRRRLTFE